MTVNRVALLAIGDGFQLRLISLWQWSRRVYVNMDPAALLLYVGAVKCAYIYL